jgi:hypothetical protein
VGYRKPPARLHWTGGIAMLVQARQRARLDRDITLPAEKRAADTLTSWQQIYARLLDTDVTEVEAIDWGSEPPPDLS